MEAVVHEDVADTHTDTRAHTKMHASTQTVERSVRLQITSPPNYPKGSKYHYSRYFGPQSIYYTITWTLWDLYIQQN